MMLSSSDREQAIKLLFDKHFHQLVLSSFRYVKNYSQAEDIVQDVYVKVWQHFDDLKHIVELKAYLFKAVKNSSLNFLRYQKVRQNINIHAEELPPLVDISDEEDKTDEETQNKINNAVNRLPKHWREAFVLSKYDNLKYHEIAREMKISQKTVEKYISKALQFLRHELKDLLMLGILVLQLFFKK
jgi:RNA polymerase sigma-70 factor, ECF subfamily